MKRFSAGFSSILLVLLAASRVRGYSEDRLGQDEAFAELTQ